MRIPLLAVVLVTSAVAEVKVYPSNKHDVRTYATYSWQQPPRLATERGVEDNNKDFIPIMKEVVNRFLTQKGYQEVPQGGDMHIVSGAIAAKQNQLEGYLVTIGFDAYWGSWFGMEYPVNTMNRVGVLFIALVDSKTKEGVWAGTSTEALDRQAMENDKAAQKIEKAASRLFKKLPARK
jgi:hypothetical protein